MTAEKEVKKPPTTDATDEKTKEKKDVKGKNKDAPKEEELVRYFRR